MRGINAPIYYEMPINDKLFIAQADVIKEVAKRGSCVIVGRCADYVLENENVDVLSVFVYGSVDYRAKRVMSALDITQAKAFENRQTTSYILRLLHKQKLGRYV